MKALLLAKSSSLISVEIWVVFNSEIRNSRRGSLCDDQHFVVSIPTRYVKNILLLADVLPSSLLPPPSPLSYHIHVALVGSTAAYQTPGPDLRPDCVYVGIYHSYMVYIYHAYMSTMSSQRCYSRGAR